MHDIKVNGKKYKLPEGIRKISGFQEYIRDSDKTVFTLIPSGYQAHNDIPYIRADVRHGFESIPLTPLEPEDPSSVNKGRAFMLGLQLVDFLRDGSGLQPDYPVRMENIERALTDVDPELRDYLLPRIQHVVDTVIKQGYWDLSSLAR